MTCLIGRNVRMACKRQAVGNCILYDITIVRYVVRDGVDVTAP